MSVFFYYNDESYKVFSEKKVKSWIKEVLEKENKNLGEISYSFLTDEEVLKINSQFLNHNYFTDIITFDYSLVNIINGDIYISFDTVYSNSKKFESELLEELYRVIIHGIMHLCGYNDSTEYDKKIMREKENFYLSYLEKI